MQKPEVRYSKKGFLGKIPKLSFKERKLAGPSKATITSKVIKQYGISAYKWYHE